MPSDHDAKLSITIETCDNHLRVSPVGEVDLASSPELRRSLQQALANSEGMVVVDLSGVPYMDSSGVATLVEALQICRKQSRELILARPTDRVESIFTISKLDSVFTIQGDLP
ncbi:MAG: STAS domain-containing protein [Phycisphaerales bacterium]|nr:STAS domain-containing protein [Phycisphaerales bacterium]